MLHYVHEFVIIQLNIQHLKDIKKFQLKSYFLF